MVYSHYEKSKSDHCRDVDARVGITFLLSLLFLLTLSERVQYLYELFCNHQHPLR